jgi:hypothetical protein
VLPVGSDHVDRRGRADIGHDAGAANAVVPADDGEPAIHAEQRRVGVTIAHARRIAGRRDEPRLDARRNARRFGQGRGACVTRDGRGEHGIDRTVAEQARPPVGHGPTRMRSSALGAQHAPLESCPLDPRVADVDEQHHEHASPAGRRLTSPE